MILYARLLVAAVRRFASEALHPRRLNRRVKIEYDMELCKQRNRIEPMFGHLKINRAIATRYDQLVNASSAWSISPPTDTSLNPSTQRRTIAVKLSQAHFAASSWRSSSAYTAARMKSA